MFPLFSKDFLSSPSCGTPCRGSVRPCCERRLFRWGAASFIRWSNGWAGGSSHINIERGDQPFPSLMIFWPNSWGYSGLPSARHWLPFRTERLFGTPTVRSNSVKYAPCRNCLVNASREPKQRSMNSSGICRPILRSEEHTSELQSRLHLVCRLLL